MTEIIAVLISVFKYESNFGPFRLVDWVLRWIRTTTESLVITPKDGLETIDLPISILGQVASQSLCQGIPRNFYREDGGHSALSTDATCIRRYCFISGLEISGR